MTLHAGAALHHYLQAFTFQERPGWPLEETGATRMESLRVQGEIVPVFVNEYWTSRQRQASSLHEVSYRGCFKPQLPRFFIDLFTDYGDVVYDPFSGRGTTSVEAALMGRNVIANDINPLSRILTAPRLEIPDLSALARRLSEIPLAHDATSEMDLSMFYHPDTLAEILSLRAWLNERRESGAEDYLDRWIRMVATNRLTGHSPGFFSVYTLPPNQATSPSSQRKINEKRRQRPAWRNTRDIILKKSKSLLSGVSGEDDLRLRQIHERARFLTKDARRTPEMEADSVQLTVTSPPFLDIVQYAQDNWLRCWFNGLDAKAISRGITMSRTVEEWRGVMGGVFDELYRITKPQGWVAFEVGEVRKGSVKLEEQVVCLGINAGFQVRSILINLQRFTKTSNIWGVSNNSNGTNTNRIVLLQKR